MQKFIWLFNTLKKVKIHNGYRNIYIIKITQKPHFYWSGAVGGSKASWSKTFMTHKCVWIIDYGHVVIVGYWKSENERSLSRNSYEKKWGFRWPSHFLLILKWYWFVSIYAYWRLMEKNSILFQHHIKLTKSLATIWFFSCVYL